MIKAVIIDDEEHCRETLTLQLEKYCPNVTVVASLGSATQGLNYLLENTPDLLFLDIEMPQMNGFALLEKLPSIPFAVIFTTGYDIYAIKAIQFSALDYLLKPISRDDLQKAIAKYQRQSVAQMAQKIEILMEKLGPKRGRQKIALPTSNGFEVINTDTIVRCEADDKYTRFWLKNGKTLFVSRNLKEIEELLAGDTFLRVHQSHLINLDEILRYTRGEGGILLMSDNAQIPVSKSRKETLLNKFR